MIRSRERTMEREKRRMWREAYCATLTRTPSTKVAVEAANVAVENWQQYFADHFKEREAPPEEPPSKYPGIEASAILPLCQYCTNLQGQAHLRCGWGHCECSCQATARETGVDR